jgi:hypothetical protein
MFEIKLAQTIENGTVRFHRYSGSLNITDLTNAGKRGKTVETTVVLQRNYLSDSALNNLECDLESANVSTYAEAVALAQNYSEIADVYTREEKGVRVKPAGYQTITISNDKVYIKADYDCFTVKCKVDMYNEPTAMSPMSRKAQAVKKFYAWASKKTLEASETYHDILSELMNSNIEYHSYCAID